MVAEGMIVRMRDTKQEVGVGLIDGDHALVTFDTGGMIPGRKWVALDALEVPINPVVYGPREHRLFS